MTDTLSALVGVGSNADAERNIKRGMALLSLEARVVAVSTFYASARYVNGVVALETPLSQSALERLLKRVEAAAGRRRDSADVSLDLDLLAYAGVPIARRDLGVAYVAVPLSELAPQLAPRPDPALANDLVPLHDLTAHLRQELVRMNHENVERLVTELLRELGEDPARDGLLRTPGRVARALEFLTSGNRTSLESVVNKAVFEHKTASNMVIARDIEIYSLCEHHMLPFFGRCHIGYISDGHVLGVSKLARIADLFARRLQIQERLTDEIARAVNEAIGASGVGVVIEAQHLCMMMRGVQKQNSIMTTSSVLGVFHDSVATRTEFLSLIGRARP